MEQLLKKLKNGDRKAQEQLYKRYANLLFLTCYRYVNNEDDASEILNNGFYKAFANIHSFEFINNAGFVGWLRKIMVNECLMHLRQNRKNPVHLSLDNDLTGIQPVSENHFEDNAYLKILQSLPEGYRTVFNLYAIEGYSHQEIGVMLNISESTSRSQLSRAREILQKLIQKDL